MTYERLKQLREESLEVRREHAEDLLSAALATEDPVLCNDFISAAQKIWGKDFDEEFRLMSAGATSHMRGLYFSERHGANR